MGLFGGGNSKSSSSSSTVNQDNRNVADAAGQALSAGSVGARDQAVVNNINVTGGGKKSATTAVVNITNTDYDAIEKAFAFAEDVEEQGNKTIKDVLGVADGVFSASSASLEKSQKTIADAYSEAKGGAKAVQNIAIGLLVALVATAYFLTKAK